MNTLPETVNKGIPELENQVEDWQTKKQLCR